MNDYDGDGFWQDLQRLLDEPNLIDKNSVEIRQYELRKKAVLRALENHINKRAEKYASTKLSNPNKLKQKKIEKLKPLLKEHQENIERLQREIHREQELCNAINSTIINYRLNIREENNKSIDKAKEKLQYMKQQTLYGLRS